MAVNYGIRISQLGQDVKYCPDEKCVFTSKNNTLKVYKQGTLSLVLPTGAEYKDIYSVSVAHGLSFKPAFLVNPNDGTYAGSMITLPMILIEDTRSTKVIDNLYFEYTMDATNLTCYCFPATESTTYKPFFPLAYDVTIYFKYFIFTQALE